jgi:hypothetical protein
MGQSLAKACSASFQTPSSRFSLGACPGKLTRRRRGKAPRVYPFDNTRVTMPKRQYGQGGGTVSRKLIGAILLVSLVGCGGGPSVPSCSAGQLTVSNARFQPEVFNCPNGAVNLHYPLDLLFDARNSSAATVNILSVSTSLTCVAHSSNASCNNFNDGPQPFSPTTISAAGTATVTVTRGGACSHTGGPGFGQWSGTLVIQTSCGSFTLQTQDTTEIVGQ